MIVDGRSVVIGDKESRDVCSDLRRLLIAMNAQTPITFVVLDDRFAIREPSYVRRSFDALGARNQAVREVLQQSLPRERRSYGDRNRLHAATTA
jgi:hypothetical protein